eukprot:scaffold2897_cov178-Amphora_coffeaeformis.AAC.6
MDTKRPASSNGQEVSKKTSRKKAKKKQMTRVPDHILEEAVKHGAVRENCPGEDLCILRMTYGDKAWEVFGAWIDGLDADPGVLAIFAPAANIANTTLVPQNGPIVAPVMPINVHHAKIALNGIFERIERINDPNYPRLSNLTSGSYICNVLIQWANVAHTTTLFKP